MTISGCKAMRGGREGVSYAALRLFSEGGLQIQIIPHVSGKSHQPLKHLVPHRGVLGPRSEIVHFQRVLGEVVKTEDLRFGIRDELPALVRDGALQREI